MESRLISLAGGYEVDIFCDEYYVNHDDEYPGGYGWSYRISYSGRVIAAAGPYDQEIEAVEDAFTTLIDVVYNDTGYEYKVVSYETDNVYVVEVYDYEADDSDSVVFAEVLEPIDEAATVEDYIWLYALAHNRFIHWFKFAR